MRVRGNDTYAGLEDVSGAIAVGAEVEVYESESGVVGCGRVTEIDLDRELVYLSVDWEHLLPKDGSQRTLREEQRKTLSFGELR